MRKLLFLVAVWLYSGVALAASPPGLLKAEPDLRGEISIRPVDRPSPAPGTETSLRLHFEVKNTTSRPLHLPEIEMRVMGADGILKGYFGIQLATSLAAGESRRFFIHTDSIAVHHDDSIVLAPIRPEQERVDKSGVPAKADLLPKLTGDQCDSLCAAKDESCSAHCACGVKSFSCSCGTTGGYSYSCECLTNCPQ